ncbi:MAG: hypothetical protein JW795_00280 [Chitinivibrionales bacterium]|nr:hypothetical protein [Chitinivibrionales bacterium]
MMLFFFSGFQGTRNMESTILLSTWKIDYFLKKAVVNHRYRFYRKRELRYAPAHTQSRRIAESRQRSFLRFRRFKEAT